MQVIFKELTKGFEEILLESLIKNEKKEIFKKIHTNLINITHTKINPITFSN